MADWQYRIDLTKIWREYEHGGISVETAGRKVAEELKRFKTSAEISGYLLDTLNELISNFETCCDDEEEFNFIMQDLYDWGDTDMPTPPGRMNRKLAWVATQI
jgi:hypothetical protein